MLHAVLRRRPDGHPRRSTSRSSRCSTRRCSPTRPASRACGTSCGRRSSRPTRSTSSWPSSAAAASARCSTPCAATASAGRPLRVLTTTYTGSTERRALDQLADLGAEVRISYDLSTTRLHAKAWVFHRRSGLLDRLRRLVEPHPLGAGHRAGVERAGLGGPQPRRDRQVRRRVRQLLGERRLRPLRPRRSSTRSSAEPAAPIAARTSSSARSSCGRCPFQERLLELIELSPAAGPPPQPARRRDRHRQDGHGRPRLRPAAPAARPRPGCCSSPTARRSSTRASPPSATPCATPSFGEKWVGGARPTRFEHVFASIQSLNASDLADLPPDHFDVVIVDEFHHAAAASYERVLDHLAPVELLGLTATPERSDGLPILHWFDDRIAAELRLWDAIDQQHLVAVPVLRHPRRPRPARHPVAARPGLRRRGAQQRLHQLRRLGSPRRPAGRRARRAGDDALPRVLREHRARPLHGPATSTATASRPSPCGATAPVPSARPRCGTSPTGGSESCSRSTCSTRASTCPTVDTVLMLRPTESPTLFLQQLGRGLRKIDRARRSARCSTSSAPTARSSASTAATGPCSAAPAGTSSAPCSSSSRSCPPAATCSSTQKASEIVLRSLREAIPTRWPAKVDELRSLRRERPDLDLAEFLDESGLDLDDVYDGGKSWSDLQEAAGAPVLPAGPHETDAAPSGRPAPAHRRRRAHRHLPATPRRADATVGRRRCPSGSGASSTCSSPRSPTGRSPRTPASRRRSTCCGPTRRCAPSCVELFAVLDDRVDHVHAPARHPPGRARSRSTPATPASRSSPPSASATGAKIAAWQSGVYEAKDGERRAVRLHARQEQRRLLPHHPLPRLRHQPHPHPLGEPVDHPGRQPDRPPLPQPRARRPHRSCSSPASEPTTAPSGSSAPPPTAATSARRRWPSPGSCTSPCPATSTQRSPRWPDRLFDGERLRKVALVRPRRGSRRPRSWVMRGPESSRTFRRDAGRERSYRRGGCRAHLSTVVQALSRGRRPPDPVHHRLVLPLASRRRRLRTPRPDHRVGHLARRVAPRCGRTLPLLLQGLDARWSAALGGGALRTPPVSAGGSTGPGGMCAELAHRREPDAWRGATSRRAKATRTRTSSSGTSWRRSASTSSTP